MNKICTVPTSYILHLEEAAKALKAKDFQILGNRLLSLNTNDISISFVFLSADFFISELNGCIINTRELSAFIKTIIVECEFDVELSYDKRYWCINSTTSVLNIIYPATPYIIDKGFERLIYADNLLNNKLIKDKILLNDSTPELFKLHKNDGIIKYNYNNYLITLFHGIVNPLKSDKVYISIYEYDATSYLVLFETVKKKFIIYKLLRYLYI